MSTLPRLVESADFSPFFKSTVGFDRFMRMMEQDIPRASANSYPPYNIQKISDEEYHIEMAVAGFNQDEIDIVVEDNTLSIRGEKDISGKNLEDAYLYRGIATRNFEQKFRLADYIEVKDAALENGMLSVLLRREIPEEKKPKKITINHGKTLLGSALKKTS